MIRVTPAPEPVSFDRTVRQPGLRALEQLAEKHGGSKDAIPSKEMPTHWRNALEDLLEGYRRICAYLCLYIPRGTGAPSTDHMVPKSTAWQHVYEWSNYRLACALMNARKGVSASVLDPFEVEDGWFVLELVEFQVSPAPGLSSSVADAVGATIGKLRLNEQVCREARAGYAEEYWEGHVTFDYLSRHAPFVARELRRLHRLLPGHG